MSGMLDNNAQLGGQQNIPLSAMMSDTANNLLIDLPQLWSIFRRRLGLFLGGAIAVLTLVVLITFQLTPKYVAEATVLFDTREKQVVDISAAIGGVSADSSAVETEVGLIRSRAIAERVSERLNLFEDPEFNHLLKESKGGIFSWFAPSQIKSNLNIEAEARIAREKTVNNVMEALEVERQGLTYLIAIKFESVDPEKAALIANTFADQYLVRQLDTKFEFIRRNNEYLKERTEGLQQSLLDAESAVEEYRIANGLFESEGISLTEQQITDINTQLITQRAELAERRARLLSVRNQVNSGSGAESIAEVLSSPVIGGLRAQQAELARRKSELSTRYGERHPEMQKVVREEGDLQSQIDREIARIVSSLEGEVDIARDRVEVLETSLSEKRQELADNNEASVRLRELEREAEANRTIYESFLTSFKETSEQEALTDNDSEVVASAAIPTKPAFPNKMLNLALGVILGGGFGIFLVALAEIFDNGLRTADDVERHLGTKLVASVPDIRTGILTGQETFFSPENYLLEKPLSAFAESYRNIRSSFLVGSQKNKPKVIAFTSSLSGEGKTSSAYCLGRICAMSGDKVIVVDCDARRRILSGDFDGEHGLLQVLSGKVALREAIQKDEKSDLHVLPITDRPEDLVDIFGTSVFESVIKKLKSKYDIIILDTAPVTAVAETRAIISVADSVLFVVKWRATSAHIARSAIKILNGISTPLLGSVLTQVNPKAQTQYGYEGSYKYYSTHETYYHD